MKEKISLLIKSIIIIIILFTLVCVGYIMIDNNYLKKVKSEIKNEESIAEKELEYRILDNTTDNIKGLVTINESEGIQNIEYLNNDSETIVLDCYGKNNVSIDYNVQLDNEYNFKITTPTTTKTLTLNLNNSDIDEYVSISLGNSNDEYDTAKVEYSNLEPVTKYYKIGNDNDNWIEYTDEIDISYINYVEDGKNSVLVYAKEVDSNGNTIVNSKEIEISSNKKRKLDIFSNYEKYEKDGMDLNGYGFTVESKKNCQSFGFSKRYFCAGHWQKNANYSAVFKLDFSRFKNLNASEISAGYIYYSEGGGSWVASSIDVYYEDGTSETISSTRNGKIYEAIGNIKDKKVSYINFNIWRS